MFSQLAKISPRKRLILDLSLILLASILITIPIFVYGIPGGRDMYQHFQFAQTFYESISNGEFYPSWASNPNQGYGDVSVRFYPPLTYYILTACRFIAGNWFDGSLLAIILLFFIGSIGVYFWARESFSENASLVGGLAYAILPYHAIQIYQASFIAEFTAASFLPFCFWFVTRICRRGQLIDCLGLALSFGLVIITHLPTTVMSSIALLIYSLLSFRKANFVQSFFKLGASVLTGLLLTAFYWVRMATELDFVKHNSEAFRTDFFSYKSNFNFGNLIRDLMNFTFNPGDLMGLITIVVLIPNLFIYFAKQENRKNYKIVNIWVLTLFSLFMSTPLSSFLWATITPLQKIQFPYRWLSLFSLGTALIIAFGFDNLANLFENSKRNLSLMFRGTLLACASFFLLFVINHYFYYPRDYFNNVMEQFKKGPSNDCWWTVWANKLSTEDFEVNPRKSPEKIGGKVVVNDRSFEIKAWKPVERIFTIEAGESGQAAMATMYYPHWKAVVNGQSVEVTPTDGGMISFPVPAEKSEVRVYFQEPPHIITTYYISGLAWVIFLLCLAFTGFQSAKNFQKDETV